MRVLKALHIKKIKERSFVGANDQAPLKILGEADVVLKFGNKQIPICVLVAPQLPVDLLISWTFLREHKMEILQQDQKHFLRLATLDEQVEIKKEPLHSDTEVPFSR